MYHQWIIKELEAVMSETADFIQVRQEQLETKSGNSMLSFVDKEAEVMLSTRLARLVPASGKSPEFPIPTPVPVLSRRQ